MEDDENENDREQDRPFKGISSAFRKLKNIEELSESEKEALKNFIDEFTTVCTNESTVGENVSRKVLEVNLHSHTKSCRKYDCPCRFLYPRFPSIRTIIAEPIQGVNDEEKKERLKKYEETLEKVRDVLNDSDTVQDIITKALEWKKYGIASFETKDTNLTVPIYKAMHLLIQEH